MAVTTRRADGADLDTLVDLRARFVADVRALDLAQWDATTRQRSREFFASALADGRYVTWLAESDGAPVGCVGVSLIAIPPRTDQLHHHDGLVLTLWVVPQWRGRGVARRLMREVVDAREELSIHRLLLHSTEPARPLYESLGFRANPVLLDLA